jgi:DMSO/TMAO reductase YedYZ molybdopterin-dependent catalytic subunit
MSNPVASRGRAAPGAFGLAGGAATCVALGVAELLAGLVTAAASPVLAVGAAVVDRVPAGVKNLAIAIFGTGDKIALIVGTLLLCALIGAGLGVLAERTFAGAVAGFAAFGVVGVAAAAGDPQASVSLTATTVAVSVVVGVAVLRWLLAAVPAAERPRPGRRRFLHLVGRTAVVAVAAGVAGRFLGQRSAADVSRAAVRLPAPARTAAPAGDAAEVGVAGVDPFVTPNADFYRIDTALSAPRVDTGTWRLRVTGMVDRPLELSFDELVALGLEEHWTTLCCVSNEVGGRLIGNARWGGVPLVTVLDMAGLQLGATQIVGRSVDGWTAGFPTRVARDGRAALVAVTMNGEPLPIAHGFPARLVVPGLYGYVSATKWLSQIELTTWDAFDAYWVPRGWSKEGPVKTQSRIDTPRPGTVAAGTVAVAGVAWAQGRGIDRVEVSVDEGEWQEASLAEVPNVDTWRQWVWEWDAQPGSHLLEVRATDGHGETQTAQRQGVMPDGATGYHRVRVQVPSA